jgi:hypothetical protein
MAVDITKAKNSNPIKNGTLVTTTSVPGFYSQSDLCVKNTPTISDIQTKYDNRFDDPSYYYGIGGSTVVGG